MKQKFLLALLLLGSATAFAQPTLTAGTTNPLPGDAFISHVSTAAISVGASGAGVNWDFSTLGIEYTDTITFTHTTGTLYIDSFPGSNLAVAYQDGAGYDYTYYIADMNKLAINGEHPFSGEGALYYTKPDVIVPYPFSYNTTVNDTSVYYQLGAFAGNYSDVNVSIGDAYGTLVLPTGTYTNVVRMQQTSYSIEGGVLSDTSMTYYWFQPGFRFPLLEIEYDVQNGAISGGETVVYITQSATSAVAEINSNDVNINIYPNPATDQITLKFNLTSAQATTITISDIAGRVVGTINNADIKQGANEIKYPVSDLSAGIYFVHLKNDSYNVTRKVIIAK